MFNIVLSRRAFFISDFKTRPENRSSHTPLEYPSQTTTDQREFKRRSSLKSWEEKCLRS